MTEVPEPREWVGYGYRFLICPWKVWRWRTWWRLGWRPTTWRLWRRTTIDVPWSGGHDRHAIDLGTAGTDWPTARPTTIRKD